MKNMTDVTVIITLGLLVILRLLILQIFKRRANAIKVICGTFLSLTVIIGLILVGLSKTQMLNNFNATAGIDIEKRTAEVKLSGNMENPKR